ncbi:GDSL esterase/lipase At1g28600-like isoform X2 [Magnolia sinica]|uniref:GDSL esterase/lipase At1g28600-like isoform X2 n=1 Tax=Magnolia sinica TaxID=86752 RepID=UPI0026586078|nr:GDSL esterase/lipase At1g28600-like isoform X2 [Magnolia sinica]
MFRLIHLITIFLTIPTAHSLVDCYTSIFNFGTSLADTGNAILLGKALYAAHFPYGETYFHRPTGRFSDGRLIIDFIAQELGLPYLPPYLGSSSDRDFHRGVNFAVGGATALDAAFFQERGIRNELTNNSLGIQLRWFKDLLPSLCPNPPDCGDIFRRSVFLVGEIGGNDYNYPFLQRRSLEEIRTLVPLVINSIGSTVDTLIKYGARTLVVPGNLPIGCSAAYLTVLESPRGEDYDPRTGCLTYLNEFSNYHNRKLLQELDRLRALHPNATIIYADYFNAAMGFYRSPRHFGFYGGAITACCGGGGPYNYNTSAKCGYQGATMCDNASSHVAWDGVHLTEAAYRWIADGLIRGPFFSPSIETPCLSLGSRDHSYYE